ncbi:MAG: cysteine desulfurase family protein [Bacteroidota bacterium]
MNPEIYLDAHASTAVDPLVLEAMLPYFTQYYGNGQHRNGWKAAKALEAARMDVANTLGAYPQEVYFTSGATEAINTGVIGLTQLFPDKRHIVTQVTEHPAVLETLRHLELKGYAVTYLPVNGLGHIDLDQLASVITAQTLLVVIMLANNEIGTIHPIEAIGKVCREKETLFFCDTTQGIGWHPIDVHAMNIDLACISAHKIYGPRGIGSLYSRLELPPLLFGGRQERGVRSGTVNLPGAVGLGKACALIQEKGAQTTAHVLTLRNRLWGKLREEVHGVQLNGDPDHRHPANLNVRIPGIPNEWLMGQLPHILLSSSSACSGSTKISHVLQAIGLSSEESQECLRMGVTRTNTEEEVDEVAAQITDVMRRRRPQKAAGRAA